MFPIIATLSPFPTAASELPQACREIRCSSPLMSSRSSDLVRGATQQASRGGGWARPRLLLKVGQNHKLALCYLFVPPATTVRQAATSNTHVQPSIGGCLKFAPNTWQCCDQADAGYGHFKVPMCTSALFPQNVPMSKTALRCHPVFRISLNRCPITNACRYVSYIAHNTVAVLELHIIVI